MLQNVQADFNETNVNSDAYVKNKPVIPDITDYLCLTAQASNSTVKLVKVRDPYTVTLEYSVDRQNWTEYSFGTTITLANRGDYVCFRGDNPNGFNKSRYQGDERFYNFVMTGTIVASGNIMSLISKQCKDLSLVSYEFYGLFKGCTSLVEAPELPATTLANGCYSGMFNGCTSLKKVPDFVVTDLVDSCFSGMFSGCTSLTEAPELPATTLANSCYSGMFNGCTSLKKAPKLPATTLTQFCYTSMFNGCTSLVEAPELPATTLINGCYQEMFRNCTSLVEAPELPAMTLAGHCCAYMFGSCTSLKYAPELPATTTPDFCYQNMFEYCTSLQYLKVGFSSWNTGAYHWLSNVPATGLFVCPVALDTTTRDDSHVPSGWSVTNGANNASSDTTSEVDASSVSNYTVCVGTKQTGVVTVDSALTLNALPNESTEIAYAEIVLDISTGATVTAGSNITFVDTLTENKRNICVCRWSDGVCKLYVTLTEDLSTSSSAGN